MCRLLKLFLLAACLTFLTLCAASCGSPDSTASEARARYEGADVLYYDQGPRDARVIVFIHGWSCDSSFWSEQVPVFAKNYRVIAVDLPGFGQSDKPHDRDYSMTYLAGAVKAVLEHAGAENPVLVAHSMGFAVAREFLRAYPGKARAVCNVDGAYFRVREDPAGRERHSRALEEFMARFTGPDREKNVRIFVEGTFYNGLTPEVLRERIMSVMTGADPYAANSAMREMLKDGQWIGEWSFDIPAMAQYPEFVERTYPGNRAFMHKVFPKLTFHEWENSGHYLMLENPERFNRELLDFLKGLEK